MQPWTVLILRSLQKGRNDGAIAWYLRREKCSDYDVAVTLTLPL